jgi:uncharacterized repeat protein (TIGR01451 family)
MRLRIASAFSRRRLAGITTIALLGAVVAGVGTSLTALAAQQVITSAGPLTSIYITDDLNCQVAHLGDPGFEFYPNDMQIGACGTFLTVGLTLYGPASVPAGGNATPRTPWTPVSQTPVTGSGTSSDPYKIVTVVAADNTGITLTETDSYVVGQEVYRTDVRLDNSGASAQAVLLYRAGDCFLGGAGTAGSGNDFGFGQVGSPAGAIACLGQSSPPTSPPTAGTRIEQWVPITGGSHFYETTFSAGWLKIGQQATFPDTCDCSTFEDNWAGLSWAATVAALSSTTISHLTVFSPLGITPLATTKTADSATASPGTADGYTITVTNTNAFAVTLNSVFDVLPAGFSYTLGSTTGVTTSDPVVSGQQLTWSGPFSVAGFGGSVSLHFGVMVSSVCGDYLNSAGGDAGNNVVVPTGPTAKVTVTPCEQPITAAGVSISATEGQPFSGTVATFTDPNTSATAAEYSATIDWGDGTPLDASATIGGSGGSFTVSGVHTYAEEGTYTVTVTITDVDMTTNTATATSTAMVSDAALHATPACPATSMIKSFNGTTATFTDAAFPSGTLSDFTATINWGDGSPLDTSATISGPIGGVYTVTGIHTYATTGNFTITTTITDVGGKTATTSCTTLGFAFAPGGGSFVIGDKNAAVGTSVTFWGAQWAKDNSLSGGSAPRSFKGFAENPTAPSCFAGWTADTGNSTPPPDGPLPTYMAVIVTSSADQSGSTISGNNVHIVIVKTDPGYAANPGHAGTGTVVAVVC